MAKDPAFLFYSSDFLTGTMLMNDEQVGKYIRLMCLQHQKGHLSEKDMMHICKSHDDEVFAKFDVDESGNYFNERLESEINRRISYSESRRNNRKSKSCDEDMKNTSSTYVEHMENENENISNNAESKKAFEHNSKPYKCAAYLAEKIKERLPNKKTPESQIQSWAADIEKLNRIDRQSWSDITAVLDFSQQDEFWSKNVLSGSTLRKQYDKLYLKMPKESA